MQGAGENYLSAFALLLHAIPFQIGLLSALPQLIGACVQLLSVKILDRVGHRRTMILTGAATQAVCWVPLLLLPWLFPAYGAWLLIAGAVLYFAAGHFTIPAWNSLMTDLVHPDRRGAYFSRRSRIMSVTSFAALCSAGVILSVTETWVTPWVGFALIFVVAASARAFSTRYLSRLDEEAAATSGEAPHGIIPFLRQDASRNFRRFLLFSSLMHASVLIAGPYFVVYLLRDLHFSYLEYTTWLAAQVLAQFLTLKGWGRIGDRFGNKKLLVCTGLLVPFIPMLYLLGTNVWFLTAVSFGGGIVWAGLALGLQNYVFDVVQAEDRAKAVAVWNTVNAAGWFAGAMFGGWLATVAPSTLRASGLEWQLVSNLPVVFFVSGLLRLFVLAGLLKSLPEGRTVEPISHRDLVSEMPLIRSLRSLRSVRARSRQNRHQPCHLGDRR
jgi:MFS family permease